MDEPAEFGPRHEKTNNMVSEQVRQKPSCTSKEDGYRAGNRNSTIHVAKTKALICFAVSAKLICAFGFAYAECWFSHDAVHLCHVAPV